MFPLDLYIFPHYTMGLEIQCSKRGIIYFSQNNI